jgi:DNA-binding Lrp family transcriptional regulator
MVLSFVLITVKPGSESKVESRLSKMEEVLEIYELFGEWDILIKVNVAGTKGLSSFVTNNLRKIKDVKLSSTLVVSR